NGSGRTGRTLDTGTFLCSHAGEDDADVVLAPGGHGCLPERVHGRFVTARLGQGAFHVPFPHQVGEPVRAHQPHGAGLLPHVWGDLPRGTSPQRLGDEVRRHRTPVRGGRHGW